MNRVREVGVFLRFRVQRAVPESPVLVRAPAARDDHRQRDLAFPEIVADRFADHGGRPAIIERIIDDLEGQAEILAIGGKRGGVAGSRGGQRAGFSRGLEQRAGLGFDDGEVFLGRQVAGGHGGELAHFALGDHGRSRGEAVQDLEAVGFDQQVEGAGEQEVADKDRGLVAPDCLGGGLATAQRTLVDDVVMQQGGRVDELDGRREGVRRGVGLAHRIGRDQGDQRPKALAARRDDIAGKIWDDGDRAGGAGGEQVLHSGQVSRHEVLHPVHQRRQRGLALGFGGKGQGGTPEMALTC